jgi:sugar phosphate isomerase/epimerase
LLANGHAPAAAVEALGTNIYTVHAQDGVQGFGQSRGHLCELGTGAADWPKLLGMLQERDYRGDFILDQTPDGDPEWELEKGLKYLRGL